MKYNWHGSKEMEAKLPLLFPLSHMTNLEKCCQSLASSWLACSYTWEWVRVGMCQLLGTVVWSMDKGSLSKARLFMSHSMDTQWSLDLSKCAWEKCSRSIFSPTSWHKDEEDATSTRNVDRRGREGKKTKECQLDLMVSFRSRAVLAWPCVSWPSFPLPLPPLLEKSPLLATFWRSGRHATSCTTL